MKVNRFTQFLLAVIAINLTFLSLSQINIIPKAYGDEVASPNRYGNYALVPVNEDGSIDVRISSADELDVNITGIDTFDEMEVTIEGINTRDELDVNLDEIGGSYVSSGGPIKVEIDD